MLPTTVLKVAVQFWKKSKAALKANNAFLYCLGILLYRSESNQHQKYFELSFHILYFIAKDTRNK